MKMSAVGIAAIAMSCVLGLSGCAGPGRRSLLRTGREWKDDGILSYELVDRPDDMDIITSVSFENVLFEYDRSRIGHEERGKIEAVAEYMARNPGVGVVVEGHCDERGSRDYNMALGERRALAVRAYLIGLGVDGSRIHTVSYGAERPLLFGHDEESWRMNRRAEFILFRQ